MLASSKPINIVLIHGAWSTGQSFNFIQDSIDTKNINQFITISYNSQSNSLDNIISSTIQKITHNDEPAICIGHSLGGLIALNLHDVPNIKKIITLAAPFGGIKIERLFQPYIYSHAPVLAMLNPNSSFVDNMKSRSYNKPIRCLIATKGFNPLIKEPCDGVVTVESQTEWLPESAVQYDIPTSHYEILQHRETIQILNKNI